MNRPPVGIIAGSGLLPVLAARKLKEENREVRSYNLTDSPHEELADCVDSTHQIDPARFGSVPDMLQEHGIKELLFIGDVDKKKIFQQKNHDRADSTVEKELDNLEKKGDHQLIKTAARLLRLKGIKIIGVERVLGDYLTPPGLIAGPEPGPSEFSTLDVLADLGIKLADQEVGQAVIGKNQSVVAVEAVEGTDRLIERSAELAGVGTVMLKLARSSQDLRYDVPTVGARTVEALVDNEASLLAVEAGVTLFLQPEKCAKIAAENGLSILGWERPVNSYWEKFKQWFTG